MSNCETRNEHSTCGRPLVAGALDGESRVRTPAVLTNQPLEISEARDLECRPLVALRSSSHLESFHPGSI